MSEFPSTTWRPAAVVSRPRHRWVSEANIVTAVFLALYVTAATVMVFHFDFIMEDALARVSNAEYVLFSRQPKLSAVGFVWTPLPSLSYLPFLWLKTLWPDLVTRGYLANLGSAVAMAASVRVLGGILVDLRVRRPARLALIVVFGLQPLIVFYAMNGMTEALLIVFVLLATRRLLRWLEHRDPQHLVAAGLALALGYLARYEVAAVGVAAVVFVFGASWWRSSLVGRGRRHVAVADAALVGLPVFTAFVLWAAASWIIVGHPFEQFSSQYGNSALIANAGGAGPGAALTFVPTQWLIVAPLLLPAAAGVLIRSVRQRDLRPLVPLFLLGAVPLFEAVAYLSGSLFGFLRYQIALIPLFALLVGFLLAPRFQSEPSTAPAGPTRRRGPRRLLLDPRVRAVARRPQRARPASSGPLVVAAGAATAAVLMLSSSISTGWVSLTKPSLASQEYALLRPMMSDLVGRPVPTMLSSAWVADRLVARDVDAMHLPVGSVLLDSASGFAVIAASRQPQHFVVTSDTDFHGAVTDPIGHHIQYMLISDRPRQIDEVGRVWTEKFTSQPPVPWVSLATRFNELPGSVHQWSLWKVDLAYKP